MPELTDLSYVRPVRKYDFALSKGFGQNFIVNPGLPPRSWMPAAWTSATACLKSAPASAC